MQQILDNLKDLPSGTGAKEIDLIFLKGVMESPIVRSLAKVGPTLADTTPVYPGLLMQGQKTLIPLSVSLNSA